MKNRFEQPWPQGILNRLRTKPAKGESTPNQLGNTVAFTTVYKTDDPEGPKLKITHDATVPFPKVRTDGKGGFVIRPRKLFRRHPGRINVIASKGAEVYTSGKVLATEATATTRATLSVRRISQGWSITNSELHVRGDAGAITVSNAHARVEGHLTDGIADSGAVIETGTADIIRVASEPTQSDKSIVTVRKGGVDELTMTGNAHADIKGIVGILKGKGENNSLKTAGIRKNDYEGVPTVEYR